MFIGYENEKQQLVAAGLFLGRKMPFFNKYLYYCPHGYLLDYQNSALWSSFERDLQVFLKKERAFELVVDPYIAYQQRDINGDVVLGGFNIYYENIQPRFHFRLPLYRPYKELVKDFDYQAQRRIRNKNYLAISVRELQEKEIPDYKHLMESTAERRGFIDRPLSYYQNMYHCLHPQGILRYFGAEMDFVQCQKNIEQEISKIQQRLDSLRQKNPHSKKTANLIHEEEIVLNKAESLREQVITARQEKGDRALLSVVCLLSYGKEAVMLLAGNDEKFLRDFGTSNIIVSELIQLSQNEGYQYYNFYGISGDFNPQSELYGLYSYKKQYGGEVCEYIGEFTKVLDPWVAFCYRMGRKTYQKLRKKH